MTPPESFNAFLGDYWNHDERCHRVGLVHHGKMILEGDPAALMRGHASFEEVFLGQVGEVA